MKTLVLSLLVLLVAMPVTAFAAPPSGKRAQDLKSAEELNGQAKQAFRDGQFDRAADLFMQVYDLALTPTAVFNAARAREQAHKLPEARALLELYLKIDKTPGGIADGQARLAAVDQAIAAQAQAEADARKKAEAAAVEAARQTEAARQELERQRAEKLRADAERARLEAEKARLEAQRKATTGLVLLPPTGTTGEETERVAREVQAALLHEAQEAALGNVWSVTDYLRAELARAAASSAATSQCDFRCRLDVARNLGAAYAVTTTLRQDGKELRARLVLWQTADAAELAAVEATGWTLGGLSLRAQRVAGDLFNGARRFALTALPLPAGVTAQDASTLALTSDPPGALATVDELDLGPAPLTMRLAPGTHRLRLALPGFHARAGVLSAPNHPQKLSVTLPAQLPDEALPAVAAVLPAVAAVPVAAPAPVAPAAALPPVVAAAPHAKPVVAAKPVDAQPEAKPVADQGLVEDKTKGTGADKKVEPSKSASTFVWGVVPHLEGGLAIYEDANSKSTADVNWGAGGFVHMSSADPDTIPVASWIVGARYQKYAGLLAPNDPPAAAPSGVSIWTGVLFPRFSGFAGSLHYNHVNVHSGQPSFDYFTAQLRLMSGKGLLFYSLGAEFMLKSLRPQAEYDDMRSGPLARITFEFGFNIGGTPLSK
jgi:hypothetical protein